MPQLVHALRTRLSTVILPMHTSVLAIVLGWMNWPTFSLAEISVPQPLSVGYRKGGFEARGLPSVIQMMIDVIPGTASKIGFLLLYYCKAILIIMILPMHCLSNTLLYC